MPSTGEIIQGAADNSKELVKAINLLSGEVAIFKEALNNDVSNLNDTLGITNKSVKELKESITGSTDDIIKSNKKLASSQNIVSVFLLIVTAFQAFIMYKQVDIMDEQRKLSLNVFDYQKKMQEIELRPVLEANPYSARYDKDNNLEFDYQLFNSGKSAILNITRCHSLKIIDKETGQENQIKPESCISNKHDKILYPERKSLIHQDSIGNYHLNINELDKKYYRIDMKVNYQTEEFIGKSCSVSRGFNLFPVENNYFKIQSLSYFDSLCTKENKLEKE